MTMRKRFTALALLAAMVCMLPISPALAWKIAGAGTVSRGAFSDSGVSFRAPDEFVLKEILRGGSVDEIVLEGLKDINGFIPEIHVLLRREPIDLTSSGADADLDFVATKLEGTKAICLVDEKTAVQGGEALRRIIFYIYADKRMGVLYRTLFNVGGVGVVVDYRARTATRSLPDDLAKMPALVESLIIE